MRIRYEKFLAFALCALLLNCASSAFSKSASGNSKQSNAHKETSEPGVRIGVDIFLGNDHDSIREYFHNHTGSLPPGLAKREGDLPPGLQKQLQRNGHLPPGLEKKVEVFPADLERRLPPLKPGLVRGVIEGRALIFDVKTSVILDIFSIF